jgi:hypothetical protein
MYVKPVVWECRPAAHLHITLIAWLDVGKSSALELLQLRGAPRFAWPVDSLMPFLAEFTHTHATQLALARTAPRVAVCMYVPGELLDRHLSIRITCM